MTDSGANIKKAFRRITLPGYDEDTSSDSNDKESNEDESFSVDLMDVTIEHHPFSAHTIQLVVKDGLAKAGPLGTVVKKCSNLVFYVRKSNMAADILRGKKRIQASNTTRWNSKLKIRSI